MPYVLTQILAQMPLTLLASFVGTTLLEPIVRSNGIVVFCLCFLLAPAISFSSIHIYRRIDASFGGIASPKNCSFGAVAFGAGLATLTLGILLLSLYLLGVVSFSWSRANLLQLFIGAGLAFVSAPIEEVIFRGVLQ